MSKAVEVARLPKCQATQGCNAEARYDIRTWTGQWGYACPVHYPLMRASIDLGTGRGQYLYLAGEEGDIPDHAR